MEHKEALMASLLAAPEKVTFDYGAMISRPITQDLMKSVKPDGFPLPHGKAYTDTTSLVADVFKRCRVEGYNDVQATKFAVMVLEQFEGSAS